MYGEISGTSGHQLCESLMEKKPSFQLSLPGTTDLVAETTRMIETGTDLAHIWQHMHTHRSHSDLQPTNSFVNFSHPQANSMTAFENERFGYSSHVMAITGNEHSNQFGNR